MAWSKFVDLEMDDEEKMDSIYPIPMDPRPDYPVGLRICLTTPELEKLGLDADCEPGDVIDMRCFAAVTNVNKNDDCSRVELQIQMIAVEDEMTESE
jgi:hypothetical protein